MRFSKKSNSRRTNDAKKVVNTKSYLQFRRQSRPRVHHKTTSEKGRLQESNDNNGDIFLICREIIQESRETNVLEIKNEGDLERAQIIISEFLERNAPSYALMLEVAIHEALKNGFCAGGRVTVKTRRVGGKIIIRIKDDGSGFNTKEVNIQLKEDMHEEEFDKLLEVEGARGILLMRLFCDKVIYNAKGNEVLLMKKMYSNVKSSSKNKILHLVI